jgi:hypothetical protein
MKEAVDFVRFQFSPHVAEFGQGAVALSETSQEIEEECTMAAKASPKCETLVTSISKFDVMEDYISKQGTLNPPRYEVEENDISSHCMKLGRQLFVLGSILCRAPYDFVFYNARLVRMTYRAMSMKGSSRGMILMSLPKCFAHGNWHIVVNIYDEVRYKALGMKSWRCKR